jgi:hypothetical protein
VANRRANAVMSLDEGDARNRALRQAAAAAVEAVADQAAGKPPAERASGGLSLGLGLGNTFGPLRDRADPVDGLIEQHDELAEYWGEQITYEVFTTLVKLAGAAVADLAERRGKNPAQIVRKLTENLAD